jgi:hypothetical protein
MSGNLKIHIKFRSTKEPQNHWTDLIEKCGQMKNEIPALYISPLNIPKSESLLNVPNQHQNIRHNNHYNHLRCLFIRQSAQGNLRKLHRINRSA